MNPTETTTMDYEQLRQLLEVASQHDDRNAELLNALNEWINTRDE